MNALRLGSPQARILLWVLAIPFVALPVGVNGQEGRVLTLEDALGRAGSHNPEYQQALNDLGLNEVDRRTARDAFLPRLSFSIGTNVRMNRQLISTDVFGNPVENPLTEWRTSSGSSQSFSLNIPIFAWGTRFDGLNAQRARAKAREAGVSSRLRTLQANVIRAYRNAQNQRALLAAEEALLESRQLDLETTQRIYELAGASRVEVLTAELALQRLENRIQEAQAQLQRALLTLRTLVGDPELSGFQVAEDLPQPFDPEALDPETLIEIAYTSNPLLLQQEANLAAVHADTEAARGRRWPEFSLSLSFSQSDFGQEYEGLFDFYPDRSRGGGASFGLSLPVFPRTSERNQVVTAEISLANTEEGLKGYRLQLEEQVYSRFIGLQTAYRGYVIALRSRDISEQSLRLAREQFRLGSRSFTELRLNIDDAAQAERDVISRLFDFLLAKTNLEETVGVELDPVGGDAPPAGPERRSDLPGQGG